jgi:hypothetical protein
MRSYKQWRKAVLRHMTARGIKNPEAALKSVESGPEECVPSTRDLYRVGEPPSAFVANQFFEGVRENESR